MAPLTAYCRPRAFADTEIDAAREHLHAVGYVVMAFKATTPSWVTAMQDAMLRRICFVATGSLDHATHKPRMDDTVYQLSSKGLLQTSAMGVAQSREAWQIRSEVRKLWQRVLPGECDLVSMDAWNYSPTFADHPRRGHATTPVAADKACWWHTDVLKANVDTPGHQGYVHMGPAILPGDRTIAFLAKGHATSRLLRDALPAKQTMEYFRFPDELVAEYVLRGATPRALCLEPGELVIWNKTLPHTGYAATLFRPGHYRLGAYVAFSPATNALSSARATTTKTNLRKRKLANMDSGRGECSDAANPKAFGKFPQLYGDADKIKLAQECYGRRSTMTLGELEEIDPELATLVQRGA